MNLTPRSALRATRSPAESLGLLDPAAPDDILFAAMPGHQDDCLGADAIGYMEKQKLPAVHVDTLRARSGEGFEDEAAWLAFLRSIHGGTVALQDALAPQLEREV